MKKIAKKIVVGIITLEAWLVVKKYKPQIIAITGSVGKTSTKDALVVVLEKRFFVRGSEKSFNSEIGVPLTILGKQNGWGSVSLWIKVIIEGLALIFLKNHYPKWLVVEVGTDRPGDIQSITRWLKPDMVVVTRFGEVPVHVEFFASRDELIAEKTYLVKALKEEGVLFVNADDKDVMAVSNKMTTTKVVSYGFSDTAMVRASQAEIFYNDKNLPEGISSKIETQGKMLPLRLNGIIGKPSIYSALAAFSVGAHLNINMIDMLEALSHYSSQPGRLKLIEGVHGSVLIDDSYNASPTSMKAALETVRDITTEGRKIVVLGDMLELGKQSTEEHRKIGALAAEISDFLITVGLRAQLIGEEANKRKMQKKDMRHFNDAHSAGKFLAKFIQEKDIVLFKGSQRIRMEGAIAQVLLHPEKQQQLLVRQDKEWQRR